MTAPTSLMFKTFGPPEMHASRMNNLNFLDPLDSEMLVICKAAKVS